MNQGRSPHNIELSWRATLDLSLETGEPPLFVIDAATSGLSGMNAVLALALLDAGRKDLTAPRLAVGGTSPLWLTALWHAQPPDLPSRTPASVTQYTAPDPTTHLAALTAWDTRRSQFHERPGNLPPWVQPEVAPESNPAAPDRWSASPLASFSPGEGLAGLRGMGGQDGWLAWAGMVMAVALLLIAALT